MVSYWREQFSNGIILRSVLVFMKDRYKKNGPQEFTLDELLSGTFYSDTRKSTRAWLMKVGLPGCKKIEVREGGKYVFKPPLPCRDEQSLLELLYKNQREGKGGLVVEDIIESIPQTANQAIDSLGSKIMTLVRDDNLRVIFLVDKTVEVKMDDDLKLLWNSIPNSELDHFTCKSLR